MTKRSPAAARTAPLRPTRQALLAWAGFVVAAAVVLTIAFAG